MLMAFRANKNNFLLIAKARDLFNLYEFHGSSSHRDLEDTIASCTRECHRARA
jgi:hypothetical protein